MYIQKPQRPHTLQTKTKNTTVKIVARHKIAVVKKVYGYKLGLQLGLLGLEYFSAAYYKSTNHNSFAQTLHQ